MIPTQLQGWIDLARDLSQIVGAIATAGALWVTFLTLRELRRQTDLANNPILKLRFRFLEKIPDEKCFNEYYEKEPFDKWLTIIDRNLQQDLGNLRDEYLVLELSNAGKSEISKIRFDLEMHVSMFESEILGYEINPKNYGWEIDKFVELGEKDLIYLPLTNTRYFPRYICSVENLEYSDVRGKKFSDFNGPSSTDLKENEILRPQQPIQEPREEARAVVEPDLDSHAEQ